MQARHFNMAVRNLREAKQQGETVKTGKELDISRKSPYAGLTMGEKGYYSSHTISDI